MTGRGSVTQLAIDAVGDADEHVLDLPGSEVAVEAPERGLVSERDVGFVEPARSLLVASENFFGQGRHAAESQEAVGFVGMQAALLLAPRVRAGRKVDDPGEVPGVDPRLSSPDARAAQEGAPLACRQIR